MVLQKLHGIENCGEKNNGFKETYGNIEKSCYKDYEYYNYVLVSVNF